VRFGESGKVARDRGPVEVVAAAFALGFHDVALALLRVGGEAPRELAGGGVFVEGVDVCEGAPDGGVVSGRGGGVDEAAQGGGPRRVVSVRGGEHLLHLLHAGQLGEHGRADDGGGPFDLVARLPGGRSFGVVAWSVAGTKVNDGGLENAGAAWQAVEELALGRVGDAGVGEDLGEGQAEDRDAVIREAVLEVPLVKDVALAVLGDEEDALAVAELRLAVGLEGGFEAGGQAPGALVVGEGFGVYAGVLVLEEGVFVLC